MCGSYAHHCSHDMWEMMWYASKFLSSLHNLKSYRWFNQDWGRLFCLTSNAALHISCPIIFLPAYVFTIRRHPLKSIHHNWGLVIGDRHDKNVVKTRWQMLQTCSILCALVALSWVDKIHYQQLGEWPGLPLYLLCKTVSCLWSRAFLFGGSTLSGKRATCHTDR